MKTIVVLTDFSAQSENAARFAMSLAQQVKARILLCHAFAVPAEAVGAVQLSWPLEDYACLKEASLQNLNKLAHILKSEAEEHGFTAHEIPPIECFNQAGSVADVVNNVSLNERACMVILGVTHQHAFERFLWGNNGNNLIDCADVPLLFVPAAYAYKPIQRIAFATDWKDTDLTTIHSLSQLAKNFDAALLVTHITPPAPLDWETNDEEERFLNQVTTKINYDHIYYRQITNEDVNDGLSWLSLYGRIEMLAMVHRQCSMAGRLIMGSHTKHMAEATAVPLMVFRDHARPVTF
ncbi:universal stress protein [Mucilaginibacter sp. CSA2-8R]|uniref:universal stress protein n=1 Tax=Mucilaginibacter sp. CSA2-8R TaxID=3141542 RepID=UPI00315DC7F5